MPTPEEIYFNKIQERSKIEILIIGESPYPKGANGVAFCKNSWDELFEGKETLENGEKQRCCGQDVLYSLGFEEEKVRAKFKFPIDLWLYMLEKGIVMINIAHNILSNEFIKGQSTEAYAKALFKANQETILKSRELNYPIIKKSDELFILGELAAKCIFKHFYKDFEDKPREVLIHPSIRGIANENKEKSHEWSETWRKQYLLGKVKYKLALLS
ncbi:hypothetical protein [Fluviicola sp.]|uniref:hypothetical protein n=1 Tax=Fluviicola sp. TaxID=1917219 RepID=UPI0026161A7A|nr:hypothetical protein [Fluviicola sp.]